MHASILTKRQSGSCPLPLPLSQLTVCVMQARTSAGAVLFSLFFSFYSSALTTETGRVTYTYTETQGAAKGAQVRSGCLINPASWSLFFLSLPPRMLICKASRVLCPASHLPPQMRLLLSISPPRLLPFDLSSFSTTTRTTVTVGIHGLYSTAATASLSLFLFFCLCHWYHCCLQHFLPPHITLGFRDQRQSLL